MFCVGSLLGLLLEVFWEPQWRPRASKRGSEKSLKIMSKKWSSFDQFGGPFGVQNGAQHRSKIDYFFIMILRDFWEPLFDAFGIHLDSQNTSKMRPKRGPKTEHWKTSILLLFTTLETHSGGLKNIILGAFLVPFLEYPFWTSFWSILNPFGDPLGPPLGTPKATLKTYKETTQKDTKRNLS